jgi:hypothetical protein
MMSRRKKRELAMHLDTIDCLLELLVEVRRLSEDHHRRALDLALSGHRRGDEKRI